jgi:Arc/MetJ-type ribon-helix-helix transcriptional regulator
VELDKKIKVERFSFSMPKDTKANIERLRKRSANLGVLINQSEVIRTGLNALDNVSDDELKKILALLVRLEPGRPRTDTDDNQNN